MAEKNFNVPSGDQPTARVRPMGLRDLFLLIRLQRHGASLQLEQTLTHPRTPLWTALTTPPFPWYGTGSVAYVLSGKADGYPLRGIIQLQKRPARPEADILFIAPQLGQRPAVRHIWVQLLKHSSCEAQRAGIQRLYAALPEDPAMLETLRAAGFSFYAREEIWRRDADAALPTADGAPRPFDKADDWPLQRLYTTYTPRPVQQAEGRISGEEASQAPMDGETVLVAERHGEIVAALRQRGGPNGHWLQLAGNPQESEPARALLGAALAAASGPVYVGLREYQSQLREALEAAGFTRFGVANRLVKYNVAFAKTLAPKKAPALEAAATTEPTLTAISEHRRG